MDEAVDSVRESLFDGRIFRYDTPRSDTTTLRSMAYDRSMQDFRNLMVWQRARSFSVAVHEASRSFRRGEAPGLQSQLRRAAMSIASTIAEGAGRESRKDFARFLSMAIASASEVEHHLTQSHDLGVMDRVIAAQVIERVVEIRRMLFGLRRALLAKGDE